MTTRPRVLVSFDRSADNPLKAFADVIHQGLTGNPAFPNPPVSLSDLQTAITDFSDALVAQEQVGTLATAVKKAKRATLVTLLRKLAGYVEDNCNGSLTALLSSGFTAVSTSRAQTPVAVPFILRLINGHTGELLVKLREPIAHAKCYELRYAAVGADGASPWQSGNLITNSRALALNGLTPGTTYNIQVRAIGGSTGQSDWSPLTSHMSL